MKFKLAHDGLFPRCRALLMNRDVDALLMVVQTDELLVTGLPVDSIDAVTIINQKLISKADPALQASIGSSQRLVELFKPYRGEVVTHAAVNMGQPII